MVEIRRADISGHVALSAIRRSAILELAAAAMSQSQLKQWADQAAADRVVRAILDHAVWVAFCGVPIGWVEVAEDRVEALYVAPNYSGRGIGSRLLLRAEAAIRESGYAVAHIETSPNAATFYLRRAYSPSGVRNAKGGLPLSKRLSDPEE